MRHSDPSGVYQPQETIVKLARAASCIMTTNWHCPLNYYAALRALKHVNTGVRSQNSNMVEVQSNRAQDVTTQIYLLWVEW